MYVCDISMYVYRLVLCVCVYTYINLMHHIIQATIWSTEHANQFSALFGFGPVPLRLTTHFPSHGRRHGGLVKFLNVLWA